MSTPSPKVENWHKLDCRLYWAYEGPVGRKFQHGAYRQEGVVAWLIIRGHVELTFDRSSKERCDAGHWYFPRGEKWAQDFSEDAEIISLRFAAHWPDENPLFDRSRRHIVPVNEVPRLTSIARRLARSVKTDHVQDERRIEQTPKTLDRYLDMQRLFLSWMATYVELMRAKSVELVPH